MAADQEREVVGKFNANCGRDIEFSNERRVARGKGRNAIHSVAFSNDPIPIGLQFSVKILEDSLFTLFGIGVTTNSPDTGPLPQGWSDIHSSDQYWHVFIKSRDCEAYHKGQERVLQWVLDRSAGNTFGCRLLETGELHLYHNGRDVGVVWEGLPTDQPLWGFVNLRGWKVEANYIIPKVSERPSSPCPPIGPAPTSTQPKKVGASSTGEEPKKVGASSTGEEPKKVGASSTEKREEEAQSVPRNLTVSDQTNVGAGLVVSEITSNPSVSGQTKVEADITVDDVLDNFRDLFIACVDANAVVYGLEHANIIADGDLKKIERNPDATQQNEILHRCLKRSCDEEALMEVCDMMIAVRGNRKMNSLGKDMKRQLQGN